MKKKKMKARIRKLEQGFLHLWQAQQSYEEQAEEVVSCARSIKVPEPVTADYLISTSINDARERAALAEERRAWSIEQH